MSSEVSVFEMYREVLGSRLAEERIIEFTKTGELGGHHPSLYHEAIGVGVGHAVEFDDGVQPSYRSGAAIMHARGGLTLRGLIHQGFGLLPDMRSQHPGGPRTIRVTGLIGSQLPMAVGIAYSFKLHKAPSVVVAFVGDGASNEGAVHESLNIIGAKSLPMVVIIENNGIALSAPTSEATACRDLADRGAGYGIESFIVDGTDVVAVHGATATAVSRARMEGMPTLLEVKVTRPTPHTIAMGDIRSEEELANARSRDCVQLLREQLLKTGDLTIESDRELANDLASIIDDAVDEARKIKADNPVQLAVGQYSEAEAWSAAHASNPPAQMKGGVHP